MTSIVIFRPAMESTFFEILEKNFLSSDSKPNLRTKVLETIIDHQLLLYGSEVIHLEDTKQYITVARSLNQSESHNGKEHTIMLDQEAQTGGPIRAS